jgi:hypothetical protein
MTGAVVFVAVVPLPGFELPADGPLALPQAPTRRHRPRVASLMTNSVRATPICWREDAHKLREGCAELMGSLRTLLTGVYAANLLGLSEQLPTKVMLLTDGTCRIGVTGESRAAAGRPRRRCPRSEVKGPRSTETG